jgi:putative nucleotidyltransferase with HDIG domain
MPLNLLVIEDSADDAELLVRALRRGGYDPSWERVDGARAMESALERRRWDLVVSDDAMAQFDALQALRTLKRTGLDIPFIIVSGTITEEQAVQAMKAGAYDYLVKGRLARLIPVVSRALAESHERRARHAAERALREHRQQLMLELATAYEATIEGWARALDLRDQETEGHSRRVTDLALRLARAMGVSDAECVHIRHGALLHDIGKMGVPDTILLKPGQLDPQEMQVMRRHPEYARDLLEPIEYLRPALDIPYGHHERWDGAGYPRGLRGEAIPLAARIFAAADIWDALRSDRPYRPAWSNEDARAHVVSLAGTHLDPDVVRAFLDVVDTATSGRGASDSPTAPTVLLVDDFRPAVTLLSRWLAADGYTVVTAESGDAALTAIHTHRPDLVVLDIEIPEPDGLAVYARLRGERETAETPVIFLSGLEPPDGLAHADRFTDYLRKPVDAFDLRARIRQALVRTYRMQAVS